MENTSDSFMPGSLLFCMKSKKSVCYSVADNIIEQFDLGKLKVDIQSRVVYIKNWQMHFSVGFLIL